MLVGVIALVLVAGCGGGDDDDGSSDDAAAGTAVATSSGGSGSDGGDTVEIEPFSMALPGGVIAEISRTDIGMQLYYPADDYDEVVKFFDDWTDAEPEEYERLEKSDVVGVGWVWLDGATTQNRTIDVIKDFDGGNNFGTVTWVLVADEKAP
jgi:hypothetical protein